MIEKKFLSKGGRMVEKGMAWSLRPTLYSRFQTIHDICKALKNYPEQSFNTVEAMKWSAEFVETDNIKGPVGCLSEYYNDKDYIQRFNLHMKDGMVLVSYDAGKFIVTDIV